jgi:chromosome segregation protein
MRVSRLEVFGFKSFMNRLMLPIEGGITGVVGPNGCGKSNIVDALRWVLGETRASNLRGELLEDVIFNGTDKLRPLGLAEVSITLRSSGENFFSDLLTPLEVLRLEVPRPEAVDTDAGSTASGPKSNSDSEATQEGLGREEQLIEPQAVEPQATRLRVIDGMKGKMPDAGTDSPQIDTEADGGEAGSEQLAASEDGAGLDLGAGSELAAGSGLSGEQLPPAALLNRFAWLKATSEVQITRRLYRSGESEFFLNRVPCKLKDIKDLLRAVGLGPRSYTIVAQGEIGRIVSARPEERRAIIEEAAGVLGIKERIASAKRRLEETRANLVRLDDVVGEVSRQVASLKRQASRAENRAELKSRLKTLDCVLLRGKLRKFDSSMEQLTTQLRELQERESSLVNQSAARRADEEAARAQLTTIEAQGDALRLEIDQIKEGLRRRERQLFEQESREKELRSVIGMKRDEAQANQDRADTLRTRRTELEQERTEAQRDFDSVSAEVANLEKGNDEELRLSSQALHSAREALRAVDHKLRTARENQLRSQTRVSELDKQLVSASPLTQIQRTLGERSALTEALRNSSKPLSDALTVPADLTKAVRAVLGERAGFLVAQDPFALAQIAGRDELSNKKSGFCLGVMRASEETTSAAPPVAGARAIPGGEAGLTRLLDVVAVTSWGKAAADQLLGDVLLADSSADAIRFFQDAKDEQGRALRREELVVTRSGEMFTADSFFIFNHEGGVLELKVRYEQLSAELIGLEAELQAAQKNREDAALAVEQAEARNKQALAESQARQAAVRALLNRQGNARGRLDATERMVRQVVSDLERAEGAVRGCTAKVAECESALEGVVARVAEIRGADVSDSEARVTELTAQYRELDGQRGALRTKVSSAANVTADLLRGIDIARRDASRVELDSQRLSIEREHLVASFIQGYGEETFRELTTGETAGNALASHDELLREQLAPEQLVELDKEAQAIRARIIREGDVDPTTIDQHREESERLTQLTSQRADLSRAAETLEETVLSLEKASVERFVSTFEAVARHFTMLIPRLFGGGKGELVLTSPETPLQSGVEILVRPPGKKPKSIELLSGGEKALCATAMIFAMFLVRPSPLCVLDEVDAPLDEANLVRLLTLIKEMSLKTQFLMITHNKQSMTTADSLVGVTMQEPGSTQILTVSLTEAVQLNDGSGLNQRVSQEGRTANLGLGT